MALSTWLLGTLLEAAVAAAAAAAAAAALIGSLPAAAGAALSVEYKLRPRMHAFWRCGLSAPPTAGGEDE